MLPKYGLYWMRMVTETVFIPKIDGEPVEGAEFIVVDADEERVWLEERFDTPVSFVEGDPVTLCFKHRAVSTQSIVVRARSLMRAFKRLDAQINAGEFADSTRFCATHAEYDDETRAKISACVRRVWQRQREVIDVLQEVEEELSQEGVTSLGAICDVEAQLTRRFFQEGCVSVTHRGVTRLMTEG